MKKHILVVSQYYYPESFRINDMAEEWVKYGYRVTVLTGIPNYPQGKFYPGYNWHKKRREIRNGVEIIRIPLIARGKTAIGMSLNYLSFVISGFLWKCFSKVRADLVFTFEVSPMTQALIGVWYAKKHKIPHYLYVQDLWPENVETVLGIHCKWILDPITKMVRYIYRNCDKIFATSPSFVKSIQMRLDDKEEKVIYWPQYAETFYTPTEDKSDVIPQDGLLNITFTGNIGTAQGLEVLPQTARLLKDSHIRVRFNIVGDGRGKESLLRLINDLDVSEYFHLIGWCAATLIPGLLAASDAAFLSFSNVPLYSMTIPAKLQSYMACGCPIIASADGETNRIIKESGCGIVSGTGDPDALAESILSFAGLSEDQKKQMSVNAIRYYKDHFEKDLLMETMIKERLEVDISGE